MSEAGIPAATGDATWFNSSTVFLIPGCDRCEIWMAMSPEHTCLRDGESHGQIFFHRDLKFSGKWMKTLGLPERQLTRITGLVCCE